MFVPFGEMAENSQSSEPSSKLFLRVSTPAALLHQDFVPPYDVNTCALAFGRTSRPFASRIAIASSRNTLLYRRVYLPWLRATFAGTENMFCGLLTLAQWACRIIFHYPPYQICI
ncbi:hypothetical protein PoB_000831400 [Plakobranchus ocellatus]|uniref:Uncharacterized protein n=1 Tax=Plakobranchus ocellatus TaxID=259542 RepID=A0AAV3YFP7_9GAST|nr:hypothetical protein PoB_000831400 [Plakobranchus ocellatus]